eukprot:g2588.t1
MEWLRASSSIRTLLFIYVSITFSLILKVTASADCKVHAFYYLWYGTPEHNGGVYLHWNHEVLPHWKTVENIKLKSIIGKRYVPPEEIHSPFYPQRGLYSSSDPKLLDAHMAELKRAGICMAVLSWWGQASRNNTHDTQGVKTDNVIQHVVEAAERNDIKISFHLEPYHGRTANSVLEDTDYLMGRFGESRALHRSSDNRPVFYVYDSYHVSSGDWKNAFSSIRKTEKDKVFIALWLNSDGGQMAFDGGFDGVYTYFASNGFSYGSTSSNWAHMRRFAKEHNLLFVPSVGPGYDDSFIRPWNIRNRKKRKDGEYYKLMWEDAIASVPDAVSITSFNEWGEGTQIEPAISKTIEKEHIHVDNPYAMKRSVEAFRVYEDYGSHGPNFYIDMTRQYSKKLVHKIKKEKQKVPLLERQKNTKVEL